MTKKIKKIGAKMKRELFVLALVFIIIISCAVNIKTTKNYIVGVENEARIGVPIATWTIGSNWWRWMNNSPIKAEPGSPNALGTELPMTKSLIFVGYDNDNRTIRVTYREFIEGLARQAFTKDLTYNLDDKLIVFENFEAKIVSVDSKSLKYIVLKEHSDLDKEE